MQSFIILLVYAISMMAVTVLFTKKATSAAAFHVGNRDIGAISGGMSIAVTWIWAPALFVAAEKAFVNGIPGLFWFLVPNVLCLFIFIPFAKIMRRQYPEGITLAGCMAERYHSRGVKRVYAFELTALAVLSTGVQLLAGSKLLSQATGLPFWSMMIILAAIAYSYSQFSGIKASVTTDVFQLIVILAACVLLVPKALNCAGGVGTLIAGLGGNAGVFTSLASASGVEVFFAFGLPTTIGLLSGPFGDQCFWQRAFSVAPNKIGRSFALGALLFGLVPLSMGLIGFIAAGYGFSAADSSMVNFEFIGAMLPEWMMIPFVFMIISGLLSTVDSNLCAAASMTTILPKGSSIKNSRLSMVVLLIAGILIANIPSLTVTKLFLIYGTLRASTLLPTVLTIMPKTARLLSAKGVCIGVVTALVVGLPIFAYGTLCNISLYKTIGSLTTVLLSGILAVVISRKEVRVCQ